ncbi:Inactive Serine/Threonine-Protein Kinase Tex14 [Manis pentadactyla]|nr:Inactive Serine/Threonine-Protein Kinase Tex14 [Manis pentadactyla]
MGDSKHILGENVRERTRSTSVGMELSFLSLRVIGKRFLKPPGISHMSPHRRAPGPQVHKLGAQASLYPTAPSPCIPVTSHLNLLPWKLHALS